MRDTNSHCTRCKLGCPERFLKIYCNQVPGGRTRESFTPNNSNQTISSSPRPTNLVTVEAIGVVISDVVHFKSIVHSQQLIEPVANTKIEHAPTKSLSNGLIIEKPVSLSECNQQNLKGDSNRGGPPTYDWILAGIPHRLDETITVFAFTETCVPCQMDGCDSDFARFTDLQRHVREHHRSPLLCPQPDCNWRGVKRKGKLEIHLQKAHPEIHRGR